MWRGQCHATPSNFDKKWQYLENCTRWRHGYDGRLIGNNMQPIEWWHYRWLWVTPNYRDESISGIPMGPVGPMEIPWEWQLDWGTDYSLASFLGPQIPVDESAARQLRDVNVALIAITPFETPPRSQRIFNQWATIKLLNFTASCSPRKMLQSDIWQLAVRHFFYQSCSQLIIWSAFC